jgi:hypothetical protein
MVADYLAYPNKRDIDTMIYLAQRCDMNNPRSYYIHHLKEYPIVWDRSLVGMKLTTLFGPPTKWYNQHLNEVVREFRKVPSNPSMWVGLHFMELCAMPDSTAWKLWGYANLNLFLAGFRQTNWMLIPSMLTSQRYISPQGTLTPLL